MKFKLLVKGLIILLACIALSVLLWVFSQLLGIYWVYGLFLGGFISSFGLDIIFSRMIAALLTILFLLSLPWVVSFLLLGKRRALVLIVGAMLIVGGTFAIYYGSADVFFDRETGKSVKFYVKTLDGFKFSNSDDYDPKLGIKYKPITPESVKEFYFWEKTGKMQNTPSITRGKYFDQITGEPIVWYAERPEGVRELFPLPGHDPLTGKNLMPMTAEVVEAIARAEKEQELKQEEERKTQIEAQLREKKREQALLDEQKAKEEQKLKEEKFQREKALKQEQKSKERLTENQKKERELLTEVEKKEQKRLAEIQTLKQEVEKKESETKALKAEKLKREEKDRETEAKTQSLPKRQIIKFDMDSYSKAKLYLGPLVSGYSGKRPLYNFIRISIAISQRSQQVEGAYYDRGVLDFYIRKLYTIDNYLIVVMETLNDHFGASQTIKFNSIKLEDELGREHEAVCIYNISTGSYNDNILSLDRNERKIIAFIFPRSKPNKLFFRIRWCGDSIMGCRDVTGSSPTNLDPGAYYLPQELSPTRTEAKTEEY